MADLSTFERYYKRADMLIEKATKEQLAECARLLALNLAHHQARHGEIPLDETLALLDISEPNEAQAQLLTQWDGDSGGCARERLQRTGGGKTLKLGLRVDGEGNLTQGNGSEVGMREIQSAIKL